MLFSQTEIAAYINQNFEPVWQSVRPVPQVSIDFGNGNIIKRTLNGNIATYVCTADGTVVDILPGIYQPTAFLESLKTIEKIANSLPAEGNTEILFAYHNMALQQQSSDTQLISDRSAYGEMLAVDTTQNETERRAMVHRRLLMMPNQKFKDINGWLYREVLHADLADPYLGLKPVLFGTYPFNDDHK